MIGWRVPKIAGRSNLVVTRVRADPGPLVRRPLVRRLDQVRHAALDRPGVVTAGRRGPVVLQERRAAEVRSVRSCVRAAQFRVEIPVHLLFLSLRVVVSVANDFTLKTILP